MSHGSSNPPRRRRSPEGPIAPSPFLVALVAWALPGLGYWLVGARGRALVSGITILLLYVFGLLIGGVRVIDVPGYDGRGYSLGTNPHPDLVAKVRPKPVLSAVFDKAWYIPQSLTGPVNIVASYASISVSRAGYVRSTARLADIGTLYTAVAGMLNLFILIDSAHRAAKSRENDPRLVRM
jgi:hypothetical protein